MTAVRSASRIAAAFVGLGVLVSASSLGAKIVNGGNCSGAKEVGKLLGERAKEAGVSKVAFDRNGFRYHGRVKAFADAAREAGLVF